MTPESLSIRSSSAPVLPTKPLPIFFSFSPWASPMRKMGLLNFLVLEPTDAFAKPMDIPMSTSSWVSDLCYYKNGVTRSPECVLHILINDLHSTVITIDGYSSHHLCPCNLRISSSKYHCAFFKFSTGSPLSMYLQIYLRELPTLKLWCLAISIHSIPDG